MVRAGLWAATGGERNGEGLGRAPGLTGGATVLEGRDGSGPVGSTTGRVGSGREGRVGEATGDRVFMESVLFMGAFPARRCGARPGFQRSPYNNPPRMTLGRVIS